MFGRLLYDKMWKPEKLNFHPMNNLTAYDKQSIMHFDGTLRGRFSTPVITDKLTGKGIAINRELSLLDIEKLNKLYPCKSAELVSGKFW